MPHDGTHHNQEGAVGQGKARHRAGHAGKGVKKEMVMGMSAPPTLMVNT